MKLAQFYLAAVAALLCGLIAATGQVVDDADPKEPDVRNPVDRQLDVPDIPSNMTVEHVSILGPQNVIFVIDLSRSLVSKRPGQKDLTGLVRSLTFASKVVKLIKFVNKFKFHDIKVSITAFSRFTGKVVSLDEPESLDFDYLLDRLEESGSDSFTDNGWNTSSFKYLLKPGNGYTSMDVALKVNVGNQLRQLRAQHRPLKTTVFFLTDGRAQNFQFRHNNNAYQQFSDSLALAKKQALLLRKEFKWTGLSIYCGLLRQDKFAQAFAKYNYPICNGVFNVEKLLHTIEKQVHKMVKVVEPAPTASPTVLANHRLLRNDDEALSNEDEPVNVNTPDTPPEEPNVQDQPEQAQ